jgi:transcriptional regulator with XRE-family HTH domain
VTELHDIFEFARLELARRVNNLSDEVASAMAGGTIADRVKWGMKEVTEISEGLISTGRLATRLGRGRNLIHAIIRGDNQNPTLEVLKLLEDEIGLPVWFIMGRMEQRNKASGPASMIDRLPAHLRELLGLARTLPIVTEALELAYLVAERNLGPEIFSDLRANLERIPK